MSIKGRIDGLMKTEDGVLVEEIKSTVMPGELIEGSSAEEWPQWCAQLALYVWLLDSTGEGPAQGQLVVVSVVDGTRVLVPVSTDNSTTQAWVQEVLEALIIEREDWISWRQKRLVSPVPFAHSGFRVGQDQIAREAQDAVERGQQLLLNAPTGTGKTAAVLNGVLEAAARRGLRVFYATSKGTQREMVERTLRSMVDAGLSIRAVSLTARDKMCPAHQEDCPGDRQLGLQNGKSRLEHVGLCPSCSRNRYFPPSESAKPV